MLEADSRGLWQARPQDLSALHSAVLAVEGDLEEAMGQVDSEFQGARVEVLTARQVDKWQPKWSLKSRVS
jgi:cobaltochelatase CobN